MSMSTYVVGFADAGDVWQKHKRVYDACKDAGVSLPEETEQFFGFGKKPDPNGITVDLADHECCAPYKAEMQDGFEIDIRKLPKNIRKIRFYNSY
jgi:hypothetical protein